MNDIGRCTTCVLLNNGDIEKWHKTMAIEIRQEMNFGGYQPAGLTNIDEKDMIRVEDYE